MHLLLRRTCLLLSFLHLARWNRLIVHHKIHIVNMAVLSSSGHIVIEHLQIDLQKARRASPSLFLFRVLGLNIYSTVPVVRSGNIFLVQLLPKALLRRLLVLEQKRGLIA